MKTVQLTKDSVLRYFKVWLNGDTLVHDVCKRINKLQSTIEEHNKGERFILEGIKEDIVVISDLLSCGNPSNKHHYIMDKEHFDDYFEVEG